MIFGLGHSECKKGNLTLKISAIDALNNWRTAIDNGDLAGLDNLLADDFTFENRAGDHVNKNAVLEWANKADFTCNDFVVYHEDENVVCYRHSFEEPY
jgi:hypothetical protein